MAEGASRSERCRPPSSSVSTPLKHAREDLGAERADPEIVGVLVPDEPTNHLDIDPKAMLVKLLREYEGTLLFVSHDRKFLSALSNRVLELTPGGPRTYGGGYDEYVAQTGQEAPGLRQ